MTPVRDDLGRARTTSMQRVGLEDLEVLPAIRLGTKLQSPRTKNRGSPCLKYKPWQADA